MSASRRELNDPERRQPTTWAFICCTTIPLFSVRSEGRFSARSTDISSGESHSSESDVSSSIICERNSKYLSQSRYVTPDCVATSRVGNSRTPNHRPYVVSVQPSTEDNTGSSRPTALSLSAMRSPTSLSTRDL